MIYSRSHETEEEIDNFYAEVSSYFITHLKMMLTNIHISKFE